MTSILVTATKILKRKLLCALLVVFILFLVISNHRNIVFYRCNTDGESNSVHLAAAAATHPLRRRGTCIQKLAFLSAFDIFNISNLDISLPPISHPPKRKKSRQPLRFSHMTKTSQKRWRNPRKTIPVPLSHVRTEFLAPASVELFPARRKRNSGSCEQVLQLHTCTRLQPASASIESAIEICRSWWGNSPGPHWSHSCCAVATLQ